MPSVKQPVLRKLLERAARLLGASLGAVGLLFLLAILALEVTTPWSSQLRSLAAALPTWWTWLLFGAGAVLSFWFHQLRLAAFLALQLSLVIATGWGTVDSGFLVAVLLVNLLWVSFLPMRSGTGLRNLWPLAVPALQLPVLASLASHQADQATSAKRLLGIAANAVRGGLDLGNRLGQGLAAALFVLLVAAAFLPAAWRTVTRRSPVDRGLFWCSGAVLLGLLSLEPWSRAYLLVASLLGVVVLLETSHRLAYYDELTQLPGRRALNDALVDLSGNYAIAMVDIDHFKRFNDRHGHEVGDQVLRLVASQLKQAPGGGRAYRYGGEEFAVLYPGRDLKSLMADLETLRDRVAKTPFSLRGPSRPRRRPQHKTRSRANKTRQLSVTVSIGAAQPTAKLSTPNAVLKAADKALYRAKRKGRNRVSR